MLNTKIKQNKKNIYVFVGVLLSAGVILMLSKHYGLPYYGLFRLAGVLFFIIALQLGNTYIFSEYFIEISDRADNISQSPKLFIYTTKRHNINYRSYIIAFDNIISIEKCKKPKYAGPSTVNMCANFMAREIYKIKYLSDEGPYIIPDDEPGRHGVMYVDCDDDFANLIKTRIEVFGKK